MANISTDAPRLPRLVVPAIYSVTIFLSASLLFFVQPLFTKIVLPHVGGASAVWTTAMLFFQTVLICGYLYAHFITRRFALGTQLGLHMALWALALFFLPVAVAKGWQYDASSPAAWQTLLLFAGGVGLPFAVLSANAPLIQSWYARTGAYSASNPYFLYGSSNLGSLLALLAFPIAAEPLFGADQINLGWTAGFWVLGGLLVLSGLMVNRDLVPTAQAVSADDPPNWHQKARWALIAFVPSSLMLSVTTKISTDIGSIPMVWVVPLAIYLLTFVLVFTNRPIVSMRTLSLGFILGLGALTVIFSNIIGVQTPVSSIVVMLVAFALIALFAHALLYSERPSAAYLTNFYVTMSVGGALGGLFNSIIAPWLFSGLLEGPITVAIATLLLLNREAWPSRPALWMSAILLSVTAAHQPLVDLFGRDLVSVVVVGGIFLIALTIRHQVQALALAFVAILVVGQTVLNKEKPLFVDRSFFGTHQILEADGLRIYGNGASVHGAQRTSDFERSIPEPQFYYHRNAPIAQILTSDTGTRAKTVGVVGLGVGALACYSQGHQNWHFYEIDPLVDLIARDPKHFTFMSNCAPDAPTHLGDARIVLNEQAGLKFDILVIDAYSSNSIPVHLTTLEAVALYVDRLAEDGMLLFHISSRYYDVDRVLGRIAEALSLHARIQLHPGNKAQDPGDSGALVVAMARNQAALGDSGIDTRWHDLPSDGGRVWTDDYANVLGILR